MDQGETIMANAISRNVFAASLWVMAVSLACAKDGRHDQQSGDTTRSSSPVVNAPPPSPQAPALGTADLTITSFEVSPNPVARSQEVTVRITVLNKGDGPSGFVEVDVRGIQKSQMGLLALALDNPGAVGLKPGEVRQLGDHGSLVAGWKPGTYELAARLLAHQGKSPADHLDTTTARQVLVVKP
jgi:hypothetical protein